MLDTDQLRSFIAIVDTGSFTRAASRVNKTQSAVSMHIRRLEERLGRELFMKHGRGVRLSRDGENLITHARTILEAEAQALKAVCGKSISGQIRLGIPDDYADAFLADVVSSFALHHPLVEVQVFCEGSASLIRMVREGEIDLGIITVLEPAPDIEILMTEPLCWAASAHCQVENQRPLPVALGAHDYCWSALAMEALHSVKIEAKQALISSSYAAIGPIVEAGLAVTVFPQSFVRKHLRIIPPETSLPPLPETSIGLMIAPSSQFMEIEKMAELIRETIRPSGKGRQA